MPDYYNIITEVDPAIVANIANVLEIRAADPAQRRMLDAYLAEIDFPPNARVLEVGCGTGAVARFLATRPEIGEVIGLDPSSHFIETAQRLAGTTPGLRFVQGSAHDLSHLGESFDVIIFHTTLCHLSRPENALAEAFHALRSGGWLAVFDGDYASTTLGTDDIDPLQDCAEAFRAYFIDNSWIGRLTPKLASDAGFASISYRSHGYTEATDPNYMLTIVDRGADALAAHGKIGLPLSAALKAEARQRVEEKRFFGHISYTSLIARKPDPASIHTTLEAP